MTKKEADKLWNEIKDLTIEMFSLPNQRVKDHVTRKGGTPDSVVLSLNSPAALPSLEATLNAQKQYREKVSYAMKAEGENVTETFPKYDMEEADGGYIIVRRHVPAPDRPEFQSYVQEPKIESEAVVMAEPEPAKSTRKTTRRGRPKK